jgi:hypothetical protein
MSSIGSSTIIRELHSGSHDVAFQALWDRFGDLLHWYAARKLSSAAGGTERAHSAAVSGFGRFYEEILTMGPGEVPSDLDELKRLAVKHAMRSADRKKYRICQDAKHLRFDTEAVELAEPVAEVTDCVERLEEILMAAERRLPPKAFEVAILSLQGCSKDQICRGLELTTSVYDRYLKMIKSIIEPHLKGGDRHDD